MGIDLVNFLLSLGSASDVLLYVVVFAIGAIILAGVVLLAGQFLSSHK